MPHPRFARLLAAAGVACAAGAAAGQNVGSYGLGAKPPPPTAETLQSLDISPDTQKRVIGTTPPLDGTFYDHAGAVVSLREVIGGKPTVLVPVYFKCPRLCNQTTENLLDALRAMRKADPAMTAGDAFNVAFFSIDSFEHPMQANGRRNEFHRDYDGRAKERAGVWFLSANPTNRGDHAAAAHASITEVTNALGFHFVRMNVKKQVEVAADKVASEIQHPAAVLVLTPTGRVSSYHTELAYDPAELAGQVRAAGRNETGTGSGGATLSCFLGDAKEDGGYRTAMRILGGVSAAFLVGGGVTAAVLVARRKRARGSRPGPSSDGPPALDAEPRSGD